MGRQLDNTESSRRRLRSGSEWSPVDPYDPEDPHLWIKVEHLGRYLFAAQLLQQEGAETVVDVGCGTGYGLVELADAVPRVVGLDADVTAAAHLTDAHPAIETHQLDVGLGGGGGGRPTGDPRRAPDAATATDGQPHIGADEAGPTASTEPPEGPVGAADAVCCFEVLEHVQAPDAVTRACARLLRPGGLLVASVPDAAAEAVDTAGLPTNRSHRRAFGYDDLAALLADAGFEVLYRLGQGIVGRIIRREAQLGRRGVLDQTSRALPALHQRDVVRYLAATLGMPTPSDLGASYSITVVARRPGHRP